MPFVTASAPRAGSHADVVDSRGSATWLLPPEDASVPAARRQVAEQLKAWGLPHLVDDAELIVSELVTNALQHGSRSGPVWYTVRRIPGEAIDEVRLEVGDSGTRSWGDAGRSVGDEAVGDEADLSCSGRGLLLVETLSSGWGVCRLPHGHVVWALLPNGDADHSNVGRRKKSPSP